ncbi:GATA domain-containing protein [Cephalotus follicularis]|uniref:GATA domain-containing protein n=1 Tax=Cephalotus follicularis TaxID=3775 RepID=A0A1Q3BF49_CEPFO|nr:GATA domain-containing protein [Cephalotus follicularis]
MNGSWFFDENFNGLSDDFFEYLDFPLESVETDNLGEELEANLQELEPPPPEVLAGLSTGFCGQVLNNSFKLPNTSGTSQLKQWPGNAQASSSRSKKSTYGKELRLFQTSSPVSVLESSSSCSAENPRQLLLKRVIPVKRTRSKRPRPLTFNSLRVFRFMPAIPSASKRSCSLSASESESETHLAEKELDTVKRKQKKKKNLTLLSSSVEIEKTFLQQPTRKCTHCDVTETPQWREGPMGPKTLCNACGVRYRSGRLLPEYRPAASPTFVPSMHSNSHRKVIEMRKKSSQVTSVAEI